MRTIHESLAVLPKGQRDVVDLVCGAELSVTETADVLGLSPETVRTRLSRARKRLADTPAADLLGDVREEAVP